MSCVTMIAASPSASPNPRSVSSTWRCTITSSAVTGSSAITSRGPSASASAIDARCRMPPLNWCG